MKKLIHVGYLLMILSVSLSCENGSDSGSTSLPVQSVTWILEDSLILKSSATDTIFTGWPYFLHGHFYLFSFYDYRAFRYDRTGEIQSVIGYGRGKGPGENLYIQAITEVDSLVGFFDNWQQAVITYDQAGNPTSTQRLSSTIRDETYYVHADNRVFNFYRNRFYNYVGSGEVNYDQPGYYDGPYLGVHTLDGQLLRVSGKRAESYQAHHIPYVHTVNVAVDSFRERILVSQPASHTWEVYDLDGELIAQYGKPGQYIADQEWPDFNGTVSKARQRFIDLKYNTPEYGFLCALGSEYVIRSYRRGVADHEGLVNFLDKPHYLQVYDADGTLLADDPAPDFSFMPVGVEDGALWVNLARSYDVEDYTYTLYRYRLVVEAK